MKIAILCVFAVTLGAQVLSIDARELGVPAGSLVGIERAAAQQDWPRAEQLLFDLSLEKPASAGLWRALAAAHLKNGRYLQCATAYLRAGRLEPLDAASRFALANAYLGLQKRHWARRELENLAQEDPRNPLYPLTLAGVLQDLQWFGEARQQALRAVRLDPDSGAAHDRLGQALQGMNLLDEAGEQYRQAAAKSPRTAGPRYRLGRLLNETNQPAEAAKWLEQAARLEPSHAEAHYELGRALGKLDRWPAAIAELERAAGLQPDRPHIHYSLSQAYMRMGDLAKARQSLRRFRDLSSRE